MNLQNIITEIQSASAELKADNDAAELKQSYRDKLARNAWQEGLNQEYQNQIQLESMFGSY